MTTEERKEIIQDVIDRTLDSYPHSKDFVTDLQDLIRSHSNGMTNTKGIRLYCETKAIADAVTKE